MIVSSDYNRCAAQPIQCGDLMFTQDWVSCHIPLWEELYPLLAGHERILEIGCFEGRSSCWFMANFLSPTGTMICIDTWEGGHEITSSIANEAYARFVANVEKGRKPEQSVRIMRESSRTALARLIASGEDHTCDFIYIDGSHQAPDVLTDACMAWPLLKCGGILLFDDYIFDIRAPLEARPKCAIDAFTMIFHQKIATLSVGDQYAVRKVKP